MDYRNSFKGKKYKIYPWSGHFNYIECPQCNGKYDVQVNWSWKSYPGAYSDLRICFGGFFRSCPKIPHFHRICKVCGYKFVEHTAETIKEIK